MHKNNFDFLRLLFATLVMVTHSYALTGHGNNDFFFQLTGDQIQLSYLGVRGFFIISGFLIFQSLERSRDLIDYVWKRVLRLFPALLVMLALTVLLAPLVYDGSDGPYWSKKDVWTYLPKNASLFIIQGPIKGVFGSNAENKAVNGALWTIGYEFLCYMGLAALIILRKRKAILIGALAMAWGVMMLANGFFFERLHAIQGILAGDRVVELGLYFVGGSLLAAVGFEQRRWTLQAAMAALGVIVVATAMGYFMTGIRFVCLPILVIGCGLQATPVLKDIGNKIGDISYGVYIYGFVVQQTLVYCFGMDFGWLMVTSIPTAMLLGFASWHIIEKRALRLKKLRPTAWIERRLGSKSAG